MQKPNKVTKAPAKAESAKPSRIKPQDFPHALEKFEDRLINLGMEFDTLEKEAYPKVKAIIDGALPKMEGFIASLCMYHHERILQTLQEQMYEFLKAAPFYETKFVPGTMNIRTEIEALYRAGWRYSTSVMDDQAKIGGTIYVRPKVPKDFDEFTALYKKVMLERNKVPESLKRRSDYYDTKAANVAMKKGKPLSKEHSALTPKPVQGTDTTIEPDDEVAGVVEETVDETLGDRASTRKSLPKSPAKKMLVKVKVRPKS